MLQPFMHILRTKRIVLASTSPRRKQILENIGLDVEVVPSNFEENLDKSSFKYPYDYVQENALQKTLNVARQTVHDSIRPSLLIGADTVVTMDNKIFEKPTDTSDAFRMLSQFSGRSHFVYTGVALVIPKPGDAMKTVCSVADDDMFYIDKFFAKTEVEFDTISPDAINAYVESGEPMDKAGGYGIQAMGGTLIRAIHGDYFNVMGFPVHLFAKHLSHLLQNSHLFQVETEICN
jgi:septum formation protein